MDEPSDKDRKLLDEALKRFEHAQTFEKDNRQRAAEDFEFVAGEQWPEEIERERMVDGRPCLTINRLPQFISQVTNDARQNKPGIKIRPKDGKEETAKVFEGLVRQIESESHADHAYITALEHAATGGFGYWRVMTEYSDDTAWEQDIRIKRIINPFSVYWDPNATEYDRSDAEWCFVGQWMTKESFEAKYPDHTPSNWDDTDEQSMHWLSDDSVRVVEYWVKTPITKQIGLTKDGETVNLTADDGSKIEYPKGKIVKTRTVNTHKVEQYVLSSHAVLSGPNKWEGKYIPIVPVLGAEEYVDGEIRLRSVIRYAKDPQRQYNYWQSQITEKIALSPRSPFVGTAEMFKGYEDLWDRANTENFAYLPFNADPKAPGGKPERQQPAAMNQAELAQSETAVEDMKATTGIYDASLGNKSNEVSGVAINARKQQGETATYNWIDNLSRSIEHCGRILIDLIPRIYDTQRTVRIEGDDGTAQQTPINQPYYDEDQQQMMVHDLSAGTYDVSVDTGPSFATRRQESAESMLEFIKAYPAAAPVVGDLLAKNMDWPGAETVSERLQKLLPAAINPEDQQPSPEQQLQLEKLKAEVSKLKADTAKEEAEARKRVASAQNTHANTAATMDEAERKNAMADMTARKESLDAENKELNNAELEVKLASQTNQLQEQVSNQVRQMLGIETADSESQ